MRFNVSLAARITFRAMSLSVYGIHLWNSLDTELTNIKKVRSFRHIYKKIIRIYNYTKKYFFVFIMFIDYFSNNTLFIIDVGI